MLESPVYPRDFEGVYFWRKWQETIRFARLKQLAPPDGGRRARVGSLRQLERPVFVLGCPRSGTTYLGSLLSAIPGVSYFYEPPIMKYYARLVYEGRTSPAEARRFYRFGFRALLAAAPGTGPRIVEKNPNHTWIAESLLDAFPSAQFVMIERDGRDTALSLLEKPWHRRDSVDSGRREPGGYAYGPYPHFYIEPERAVEFVATSDIHRCAWIWRRHTEEIERLGTVLPAESWHGLRYEALLEAPDATLSDLLAFLGEDHPDAAKNVREAARAGHVGSIGRWRNGLTSEEALIVDEECGPLLHDLGYS
jgi:hypothetical protein